MEFEVSELYFSNGFRGMDRALHPLDSDTNVSASLAAIVDKPFDGIVALLYIECPTFR